MKDNTTVVGIDWSVDKKDSHQRVMICHWEPNIKQALGMPIMIVDECASPSTADEIKALDGYMRTKATVMARSISDIVQTSSFHYVPEFIYGMPWQLIRKHNRSNKKLARLKHSLTMLKQKKIPVWSYKINE